jgi:hypothetical protein
MSNLFDSTIFSNNFCCEIILINEGLDSFPISACLQISDNNGEAVKKNALSCINCYRIKANCHELIGVGGQHLLSLELLGLFVRETV